MQNTPKLEQLEIRGFKSIAYNAPLTLELGAVNILLGANGAGKSNIVGFFKLLGNMNRGTLQRYIAEFGTSEIFTHYGIKKTPQISATLQFVDNQITETYSFTLANAVPDRLIVASEDINGIKLISDFNESALLKDERTAKMHALLTQCKVFQFSDSSATSPMRAASAVESAHYLQSEGENLASFIYYLKRYFPDSYKRIVGYVRQIMPQFNDFYLEPQRDYVSLKWTDFSTNDYVMSPHQFSDGSLRFIALAALLLQPQETMPRVIIIDEPELGLHPYAIDQLTEMIKDASLHSQIIVATQSPAIIDGFSADDVIIIERDPRTQSTIARKLNAENYKMWLDDYSLSELWDKNIIGGCPI